MNHFVKSQFAPTLRWADKHTLCQSFARSKKQNKTSQLIISKKPISVISIHLGGIWLAVSQDVGCVCVWESWGGDVLTVFLQHRGVGHRELRVAVAVVTSMQHTWQRQSKWGHDATRHCPYCHMHLIVWLSEHTLTKHTKRKHILFCKTTNIAHNKKKNLTIQNEILPLRPAVR